MHAWASVFGFCNILQAPVSSGYKRRLHEVEQRCCPVEPQPTDRFTHTCEAPFWALPGRAEGHFEEPESLLLLGILSGHTYRCTSFKVWRKNGFLGKTRLGEEAGNSTVCCIHF